VFAFSRQVSYDSAGDSTEFGGGSVSRLMKIAHKMDKLLSSTDLTPKTTKKLCHQKKLLHQLSGKIDNLKTDAHWQLASKLCNKYEHVMIPVFKVSQMVNRFKRKIRSRTVREMLHWSHFAFRQRLHHKGEELGTSIHEVGEEYTTKGCGSCGLIDEKIGGRKYFRCIDPLCGYECDRDRGSGRTIYLKKIESCVGRYTSLV
jgi:putative transposase